jgi:ppGpp synthetase/RelA/SpoT-type nucleotidyltranferase
MSATPNVDELIAVIAERRHTVNMFRSNVAAFFEEHPVLRSGTPAPIHSVKSRMKSEQSLRSKIERMAERGDNLTQDNIFSQITDLAGVRVLHLLQEQFSLIHEVIMKHVADREWVFDENPRAYTWDPDASEYFRNLGLETELKDSRYTSVHYLVRARPDSPACCEIQVRTLWEEIWGEVDHAINYPHPCSNDACVEQIRVLGKLVATGTRLADSIFSCYRTG